MDNRPRRPRRRQRRAAAGTWYWCAPCAQRWQLELIPQLQAEGCPLCGGQVVPILARAQARDDGSDRDES